MRFKFADWICSKVRIGLVPPPKQWKVGAGNHGLRKLPRFARRAMHVRVQGRNIYRSTGAGNEPLGTRSSAFLRGWTETRGPWQSTVVRDLRARPLTPAGGGILAERWGLRPGTFRDAFWFADPPNPSFPKKCRLRREWGDAPGGRVPPYFAASHAFRSTLSECVK